MKPKYIRIAVFTLALASSGSVLSQDTVAPPSWTDKSGRVVQAKFIKLDGESVIIEKDGKQFAVAFATLVPASVEQAKKLGDKAGAKNAENGVDISPKNFIGKASFEECEKVIGMPTEHLKPQFAKIYKPQVAGVSRVKLQLHTRATMCMDVTYYFPKGTIKTIADALSLIGLKADGATAHASFVSTGLTEEEQAATSARSRALGEVSMTSALDKEFLRTVRGIEGGLEVVWMPAGSPVSSHEGEHPDEDVLAVNESYEQSAKRLAEQKKK